MTAPRIYSRRRGADPIPDGAVYVGRGTPWGNPFKVTARTRAEHARVVDEFSTWLRVGTSPQWREDLRTALRGRDLVCWCQSPSDPDPLPCHAEVLRAVANAEGAS